MPQLTERNAINVIYYLYLQTFRLSFKGMLDRRPNLNDVDNTDISNSELKMK